MQHDIISSGRKTASLGRAWIDLLDQIVHEGTPMGDEGLELLGRSVTFQARSHPDEILERFGNQQMIAEMQKVFFSEGPNSLGHSYAKSICGPGGRNDLQDVIDLLRKERATKRALVTFSVQPNGKVPCITAVQFLVRDGALQLIYFARGQDVFRKFYADALCLIAMGERIGKTLNLPLGIVRGFIGSSHLYHADKALAENIIVGARASFSDKTAEGALA